MQCSWTVSKGRHLEMFLNFAMYMYMNFDRAAAVTQCRNDMRGGHATAFRFLRRFTGLPFWGKEGFYSGGGYVANLGNEQAPALQLIDDLMQYNWIDRHSRALFVEFNVWNANTNLFNMVILCFELPSEGSFLTTVKIDSVQLYR